MLKNGLAIVLGIALTSGVLRAAEPGDAPPNIVFVLADDLGWADVAMHGGNAPTPHLDQLARDSVELTQHYVAPVCSPTRCGFMTGRYWSRFGINSPHARRALPWDTTTLPKALKTVGYDTCLSGKWHLGSKPAWGPSHFGFDHSYGSLGGGVGPWDHRYKRGPYTRTWHRNDVLIDERGHVTDLIADEAIDWLKSRGSAPFFLYVPFSAIHLPIKEPQEFVDAVPESIVGDVPRQYAASIMHLDDALGKIIAALEKTGQRENTLLIFTSDNGGSTAENNDTKYPPDDYPSGKLPGNNSPLRGIKGQLYEGGIRVPTIVSWPGKLSPGRVDTPVHISDWMPTLCNLAGYHPSSGDDLRWDGVNVWPWIQGREPATPRTLYWVGPRGRSKAIRHGDWKWITGRSVSKNGELFDLAQDPYEKQDVAAEHPQRVQQLQKRLAEVSAADDDRTVDK